MLININDILSKKLDISGCVKVSYVTKEVCGDSFMALACVDKLIELGFIKEVFPVIGTASNNRILIK